MDKQAMIDKLQGIRGVALSALTDEGEIAKESQLSFIADMADAILYELDFDGSESSKSEQQDTYSYVIVMKNERVNIVDADDAFAMARANEQGWQIVAKGEATVDAYELMHGFQVECESRYFNLRKRLDQVADAFNGLD